MSAETPDHIDIAELRRLSEAARPIRDGYISYRPIGHSDMGRLVDAVPVLLDRIEALEAAVEKERRAKESARETNAALESALSNLIDYAETGLEIEDTRGREAVQAAKAVCREEGAEL